MKKGLINLTEKKSERQRFTNSRTYEAVLTFENLSISNKRIVLIYDFHLIRWNDESFLWTSLTFFWNFSPVINVNGFWTNNERRAPNWGLFQIKKFSFSFVISVSLFLTKFRENMEVVYLMTKRTSVRDAHHFELK